MEVPSFQAVADDPAATEAALRAFLRTPHAAMPDLRLTHGQTDDVVAYIVGLRGDAPARDAAGASPRPCRRGQAFLPSALDR